MSDATQHTKVCSSLIYHILISILGEPLPGVYGRVSVVVDWIQQEIEDGQFCEK